MKRISIQLILVLALSFGAVQIVSASEYIKNDSVKAIADNIWRGHFKLALESVEKCYFTDSTNPLGYFLKGAIYQTISECYRNDSYKELVAQNLDRAIDLCDRRIDKYENNPDYYFVKGSALGYRGLHKAFHGSWWSAFKDGLKCNSSLKRTLELDSSYSDARWGLGSYYYYKTIKAKDFIWLPFVSDGREEGINEIKAAIDNGFLAQNLAREGLLRIYFMERRFDDLIALADSISDGREFMPNTILYKAESLIELNRLDSARHYIDKYKEATEKSEYYDSLGANEYILLMAKWELKKGNLIKATDHLKAILKMDDSRKKNAYFKDTYKRADEMYDNIK